RPRREGPVDLARRRMIERTGALAVAAPFALTGFGYIRRNDYGVEEVTVRIPNLPRALEGLRLAQLSDIHMGPYLDRRDLARAVDMTNELRPHLTLITGDLIS